MFMTQTNFVIIQDDPSEMDEPVYIGPFATYAEAQDFIDRNDMPYTRPQRVWVPTSIAGMK